MKTTVQSMSVMELLLIVASEAFVEKAGLADDVAEQRMAQRQDEGELAGGAIDVADRQIAGAQPSRQAQPQEADHHKIVVALEVQRLGVSANLERDAEPAAQVFLQPRRSSEALAAVDDLRKSARSPVHARPKLAP